MSDAHLTGSSPVIIDELDRVECLTILSQSHLGRLSCSLHDRPYITPMHFTYELYGHIYFMTTLGKKVDWMRQNPHICLAVDSIQDARTWESVIVSGLYAELPNTAEHSAERDAVWAIVSKRANWWEPACAKTIVGDKLRDVTPVCFKMVFDEISGHRAR